MGRTFKYEGTGRAAMSFILGREGNESSAQPAGAVGRFRALDGSSGAELSLDFDAPHALLVVGKRGYGKSYTLGVIAEELARARGIAPVILDPMGVFATLSEAVSGESVPATVIDDPTVSPETLDPRSWCAVVGLSPESSAGALVWQAAQSESSLTAMVEHIERTGADATAKRAATNHLALADSWGIFDADAGLDAATMSNSAITIIDVSGLDAAPMNAIARGVAESLYQARVRETIDRLPWLLIDEAHTFFDGVAAGALETILTRGRAPGVSLALVTQRPSAIPDVGVSQSDILLSHRLTSAADIDALRAAQPTYMTESLEERMPTMPGEVLIVDDTTETVHTAQIRARDTPHGGDSPSVSSMDHPV